MYKCLRNLLNAYDKLLIFMEYWNSGILEFADTM